MANEIISYFEACQREGGSLQKGMNYRKGKDYSVILMSVRANVPYRDRIEDDGATLIYEGTMFHAIIRPKIPNRSINQSTQYQAHLQKTASFIRLHKITREDYDRLNA